MKQGVLMASRWYSETFHTESEDKTLRIYWMQIENTFSFLQHGKSFDDKAMVGGRQA
jgi:hypothetical protein